MVKDPVCGMMIKESESKFVSEHEGVKFYFCSEGCKSSFVKDPLKYSHK